MVLRTPPGKSAWGYGSATARCGLCNSVLAQGDQVIIVREDGHRTSPFTVHNLFDPDRMYDHVEDEVLYAFHELEEWDAEERLVRKEGLARTCHVQCMTLEPPRLSQSFFRAIWYSYDPSPQEIARRNRWLRSQLAQVLHGALERFSMPLEVCHMIARNCCMREVLISTANTFWLETEKELENRHQLSLDADVWARYVEFQGAKYIASLQNTPRSEQMSKLYSADPAHKIKSIYVAEDHLGIRDVRFAGSSNEEIPCVERQPGIWWSTIEVNDAAELTVYNDGTKLRAIQDNIKPVFKKFEVPLPRNDRLRWEEIDDADDTLVWRMLSFVLNDPKTTGYSVCCGQGPYTILAHTSAKQSSYSYEMGPIIAKDAVWLYMPVDEDERITELWLLKWNDEYLTLIFRTSKGRTNIMGQYRVKDEWPRHSYKLLYLPTADPDRIYFNKFVHGIHHFAFENSLTPPLPAQPELPRPEWVPRLPRLPYFDSFPPFYTYASLDDVVEVTPCKLAIQDVGPAIVGLLFRYRDGRRASVGEMRLDRLQPPLEVPMDSSQGLCLHFCLSGQSVANVTGVYVQTRELEHMAAPDDAHLMNIPWSGKLEWWFKQGGCRVSHGAQRIPINY